MKIVCNNCNKGFSPNKVKVKERKVTDGITELYYKCPKCKFKYTITYQDEEVRQNIKRIKELQENANKDDLSIFLKIKNLKDRNLELSNRYKALLR